MVSRQASETAGRQMQCAGLAEVSRLHVDRTLDPQIGNVDISGLAPECAQVTRCQKAPEDFADADFTSLGKAHLRSGIRLTCTSPGAAPSGSLVPGPKRR